MGETHAETNALLLRKVVWVNIFRKYFPIIMFYLGIELQSLRHQGLPNHYQNPSLRH